METILDAINPNANATVSASAGTGKTWLLVSRTIRLLLDGYPAGGILAVTFTRKAAAEMESRLIERLREYVDLSDSALDDALHMIGISTDEQIRERARTLYERLLFSEHPIRITTFHAFCQEMLRSFPLEADVPPGFELLESSGLLEDEAWAALYEEASRNPDAALAQALDNLFEQCNGINSSHTALNSFLQHRGDWWAYTEACKDPIDTARQRLLDLLQIDPDLQPLDQLFNQPTMDALQHYTELLVMHDTKTNLSAAAKLADIRDETNPVTQRHQLLCEVLLTAKGEPRACKPSKARAKKMGEDGEDRFIALTTQLTQQLLACNDTLARIKSYRLSSAWYLAGSRLLDHYQRLKREQRLLDFTDLEWKSYQLLNNHEQSEWVQYKLDQRIEHLLIDEFQDTNPTQWQLILPLLQEMAAGSSERGRSVFLVGDKKQSIYRFRRAEPRLMESAAEWLEQNLAAHAFTMDASRRSAPAIINCVNHIFEETHLKQRIPSFSSHQTHHTELWGRVELLPLPQIEPPVEIERLGLRNPLLAPRPEQLAIRHLEEGRQIAARIKQLVEEQIPVGAKDEAHPLGHGDILILLRNRTHIHAYEEALREAEIPYIGDQRGTLLESLEIRDMVTLLETLITPFGNLSLAQILRSPLFAASDDDLITLASSNNWMQQLTTLAPTLEPGTPLARAHHWLSHWRALVGRLPVHDLLDRIYSEGNVIARYESAFPETLRPRVRANLTRFIELALEIDSGRYPSLSAFLARLRSLRSRSSEAPDEAPSGGGEPRVRLMTIHGSKGLEAPLVILADTINRPSSRNAYQPIVNWPAGEVRPSQFLLSGKSDRLDSISKTLLESESEAELREEANLLYVALTRARQQLLVSGTPPNRGDDLGWYGMIRTALEPHADVDDEGRLILSSGEQPNLAKPGSNKLSQKSVFDPLLNHPIRWTNSLVEIAPSRATAARSLSSDGDEDGRDRGLLIHRMLELLTQARVNSVEVKNRICSEFDMEPQDEILQQSFDEAQAVVDAAEHRAFFNSQNYLHAYSEAPISFKDDGVMVYGIIDRLVVTETEVIVIDYKSHRSATVEEDSLVEHYRPQIHLYCKGVGKLFPDKRVRGGLLFTAANRFRELTLE
ncbi:hypothetical protein BOW53_06830 [Solemya pervernicosa gill symbiont]|uniref:DNA 3'-5' helicase n=2 Tax=Gammaproteobacteria incertae sedis TaxID=118884 RepID=A0A1T2L6S2_9GAMM|nr:UvrD-helicase domain-containing protein [Candidatus Reidiella endopervernicosa]OOZ40636.1 hypothetical protein BOW53_06830 [Solemya pervernicosa gill symbiont]QKQ27390.1 UvrD-helicase domain-containing protein [Candidatus Reidiella endopervernicosa]